MALRPSGSVRMLELNEADAHFLDALVARGKLPGFRRMLDEGVRLTTRIGGWADGAERAWRSISPWIIWPTIYSGLRPEEHGLVAFGQDTASIRGRCVWDVLDASGIPVGVLGSLMSYPPRSGGHTAFYIPESLADDPSTIPDELEPFQRFNVLAARNYNESFVARAPEALALLARSLRRGVRVGTAARLLAQTPAELLGGFQRKPERAFLASRLQIDVFEELARSTHPRFATLHLNHVAYMQHRYWRAAEPHRFTSELSDTDRRFFPSASARAEYEQGFQNRIEESFVFSDDIVQRWMDALEPDDILLVVTALGQRPMDPVHEIHNPVVRFVGVEELLAELGLEGFTVRHQMNPDLTIDFATQDQAILGADRLRGLYLVEDAALLSVERRGRQVFVELDLPRAQGADTIRHRTLPFARPSSQHIQLDRAPEESTAHHHDRGLLLAWSKQGGLRSAAPEIDVADVAPTILGLFGMAPSPWMSGRAQIQVAA